MKVRHKAISRKDNARKGVEGQTIDIRVPIRHEKL